MAIEAAPAGSGFRWAAEGGDPVVDAFHAVRRMVYASTGSRSPADLVRTGRGACTAKHVLLCELLQGLGVSARVATIHGAFGAGLPECDDMPGELRAMIRDGGVPDYHNVVVATVGGEALVLDATWHDALARRGFPANDDWDGRGSTRPAVAGPVLDLGPGDPAARKAELVATLPADGRERRLRFLDLITRYSVTR